MHVVSYVVSYVVIFIINITYSELVVTLCQFCMYIIACTSYLQFINRVKNSYRNAL